MFYTSWVQSKLQDPLVERIFSLPPSFFTKNMLPSTNEPFFFFKCLPFHDQHSTPCYTPRCTKEQMYALITVVLTEAIFKLPGPGWKVSKLETGDIGGNCPNMQIVLFLFLFSSFPTKNIMRAKSHLELYAEKVVAAERKDNTGPERALVRDTFRGRTAGNKDPPLNSTIKQKDTKPKLIVWLQSEKKKKCPRRVF